MLNDRSTLAKFNENMSTTLPPPTEIRERIKLVREELAALKKLLRASEAAADAEAARAKRGDIAGTARAASA